MSSRPLPQNGKSNSNPSGAAGSQADRYANRRQERMRGAGNHEIIKRNHLFNRPSTSSSTTLDSSSTASTPIRGGDQSSLVSSPAPKNSSQSSNTLLRSEIGEGNMASSTPAMSVRSGRGPVPSSSPSKYIDPRLLADQSHRQLRSMTQSPSPAKDKFTIAKSIDQRRQERMRGAGIHQIEPRSYKFGRRSSDASSSTTGRSPGFLDRFMSEAKDQTDRVAADQMEEVMPNWIEQRRLERRRGAGTHNVEKRNIVFQPPSSRPSNASSSAMSESIMEEDEMDQRHANGTTLGGDDTVTIESFSGPMQSTPKRAQQHRREQPSIDFSNEQQEGHYFQADDDDVDMPQMDVSVNADNNITATESPGSIAAQKAMNKRKAKRQASPRRTVQRKATKRMRMNDENKRSIRKRVVDLAIDETMIGQADLTMEEQRGAAFISTEPPIWTFPKKPVTIEELTEMKQKVKEVVTLALGDEAGINFRGRVVKFNDADVLWVEIKRALQAEGRGQRGVIQETLDQLLNSLLETFTHLSQQSAERSRLIYQLLQARKRNLTIRKELFKKRSQVLQVGRTMQILKREELQRIRKEEDEERSLEFLSRLQKVSHEWC